MRSILYKLAVATKLYTFFSALKMLWITEYVYGHFRSTFQNACVDSQGKPIPWYTYPAIDYLKKLAWKNKTVFEFGAGYSTLFWANAGAKVFSAENDIKWYKKICENISRFKFDKKVIIRLESNPKIYPEIIKDSKQKFDLIIIDGIERYRCAKHATDYLKNNGIILLDNSDINKNVCNLLLKRGYKEIVFTGGGPINSYFWSTSIFTR